MRKKVTTDLCCEIGVDRKIVPFERVPDHAGGNYSASLCGVHLTPQYLHSAQVSRGVSLVNLLAFNTMSSSPSIGIVLGLGVIEMQRREFIGCSAATRRRSASCLFKSSLHAGVTDLRA
jgi:hypothetical protein